MLGHQRSCGAVVYSAWLTVARGHGFNFHQCHFVFPILSSKDRNPEWLRTFLVHSYGIFLPFLALSRKNRNGLGMDWEWTRNGLGMDQEYSLKISGVNIAGSFLVHSRDSCGFLGILRNPQESLGLTWLSVKTSLRDIGPIFVVQHVITVNGFHLPVFQVVPEHIGSII